MNYDQCSCCGMPYGHQLGCRYSDIPTYNELSHEGRRRVLDIIDELAARKTFRSDRALERFKKRRSNKEDPYGEVAVTRMREIYSGRIESLRRRLGYDE